MTDCVNWAYRQHQHPNETEHTMNANGTLTAREQAAALAVINRDQRAVTEALHAFASTHSGNEPYAVADAMQAAWNALHDAQTALTAERARVLANRPYADAAGVLVHHNID